MLLLKNILPFFIMVSSERRCLYTSQRLPFHASYIASIESPKSDPGDGDSRLLSLCVVLICRFNWSACVSRLPYTGGTHTRPCKALSTPCIQAFVFPFPVSCSLASAILLPFCGSTHSIDDSTCSTTVPSALVFLSSCKLTYISCLKVTPRIRALEWLLACVRARVRFCPGVSYSSCSGARQHT